MLRKINEIIMISFAFCIFLVYIVEPSTIMLIVSICRGLLMDVSVVDHPPLFLDVTTMHTLSLGAGQEAIEKSRFYFNLA